MKTTFKLLFLLLLVACQDEESEIIKCFAPDMPILIKNYGAIPADGCGWVLEEHGIDYAEQALPDQLKVDSLYAFSYIETSDDHLVCGWNGQLPYAELQDTEDLITMYYQQTQCADPWGNSGVHDLDLIFALKYYLDSEGITLFAAKLTAAPEDAIFCAACQCPTGRTFQVLIKSTFEDKLIDLGFSKSAVST